MCKLTYLTGAVTHCILNVFTILPDVVRTYLDLHFICFLSCCGLSLLEN